MDLMRFWKSATCREETKTLSEVAKAHVCWLGQGQWSYRTVAQAFIKSIAHRCYKMTESGNPAKVRSEFASTERAIFLYNESLKSSRAKKPIRLRD